MWQSLKKNFLAGLLVLLPVVITVQVMVVVFRVLDGALGNGINALLAAHVPGWDMYVPGIGLATTLLVTLILGSVTRWVVFSKVVGGVEQLIGRLPIVRTIYKAAKQLVSTFTDQGSLPFSQVVMIEYPMTGRWTMGLLARDDVLNEQESDDDMVVVFVPSNHLHLGYPVIMPRNEVRVLDLSIDEAVKFFLSCGIILDGPIDLTRRLTPPSSAEVSSSA